MVWLETFFTASEWIGIVAFAASGAMIAIDRELDLFGVLFLGITSAVGGGIVRDLILGITPPGAFRNPGYLAVSAAVSLAVFLFAWLWHRQYSKRHMAMDHIINLLDAIGLGLFGPMGVEAVIAQGYGENLFLCVFIGMTTGVGGGMLRDIFSNTVPAVLHKRVYAVAVILGSLIYALLRRTSLPSSIAVAIAMLVTVVIRVLSSVFRWNLPRVNMEKN